MNKIKAVTRSLRKAAWKMHPHPIICHRLRLLYYPIAKVGSSSLRKYLIRNEFSDQISPEEREQAHQKFIFPTIPQKEVQCYLDKGYTSFAAVRNPYERICSCYRDKIVRPGRRGVLFSGFERYNHLLPFDAFSPEMEFGRFIKTVACIPDFASDAHFRSQVSILPHNRSCALVDNLIRIENMDLEMHGMTSRLNLPDWTSQPENPSVRAAPLLTNFPETVSIIKRRYRSDFKMLGYDPSEIPIT